MKVVFSLKNLVTQVLLCAVISILLQPYDLSPLTVGLICGLVVGSISIMCNILVFSMSTKVE